ncbi:thioredoxin family protein [Carboxylicivirga sp. RSCT41]|uniref:thioredoxin family protein n=1 Tax=Carboxylicivirga agarovorans TaxID=3417570 RepID=UPI003D35964F
MNSPSLKYFSHDRCNVCKVLKPKVKQLLSEKFPKMTFDYINIEEQPSIAAQYQVFTVPTLLVYFEGKEYYRFTRNVSLGQLTDAIQRPYQLLFE